MSERFYKATQPDGRSFHTDKVIYATGKRIRPMRFEGERKWRGQGYVYASRTPWQAAYYNRGEFALWEVDGIPRFEAPGDKAGFYQLQVVKRIPVWRAFDVSGHGRQVQGVWERWLAASDQEHQAVRGAWDVRAAPGARAAWKARAAQDARIAWDAWGTRAAWDVRAAWDAARAYINPETVGTGSYTQKHYDLLVEPWESVFGMWNEEQGEFIRGDDDEN